jgi:hypothetical protein
MVIAALLAGQDGTDDAPKFEKPKITVTKAVACESITGFRDYVELPEPVVTRDDKLLLYFEVSDHAYEKSKTSYRAHLTVDVRMRKKGQRGIFWKKDKILDYPVSAKTSPNLIYMATTMGLKACSPGDYELDLLFHDLIGKEDASQTFAFRIKPTSTAKTTGKESPERRSPGTKRRSSG